MLNFNTRNRHAFIDLARLDIAEYLSAIGSSFPPRDQTPGRIDPADPAATSSDLCRLTVLGETLMAETWPEISADIDGYVKDGNTALEIKRQLANHAWCGLLAALIRWIEEVGQAAKFLSDKGKQFVKGLLTMHLSGLSKKLAELAVGIVVDKVWAALAKLLAAHFPLLGQSTLRVLRMLALFTCPSVEQHPEVYRYTVRPLMGDALKLVSDETKTQVTALFTVWWRHRSPDALT